MRIEKRTAHITILLRAVEAPEAPKKPRPSRSRAPSRAEAEKPKRSRAKKAAAEPPRPRPTTATAAEVAEAEAPAAEAAEAEEAAAAEPSRRPRPRPRTPRSRGGRGEAEGEEAGRRAEGRRRGSGRCSRLIPKARRPDGPEGSSRRSPRRHHPRLEVELVHARRSSRSTSIEDLAIREPHLRQARRMPGLSDIHIRKDSQKITVDIYTARPGIVIGKSGLRGRRAAQAACTR